MEQIHTVDATHPAPVEVGSLSHIFLQGFVHPSWCRIPSIDTTIHGTDIYIYIFAYMNGWYLWKNNISYMDDMGKKQQIRNETYF